MKARCPECQARFGVRKGGVVVPCPSCGNPVAVPEGGTPDPTGTVPGARREAPPAAATPAPPHEAQIPWLLVGGVVVVLAIAHYVLYLLMTIDARASVDKLRAEHGIEVTEAVENPGDEQPPANGPDYKPWYEARQLYVAHRAWLDHEAHRSLVASWLQKSFLLQIGLVAFAIFRIRRRIEQSALRRARESRRAT